MGNLSTHALVWMYAATLALLAAGSCCAASDDKVVGSSSTARRLPTIELLRIYQKRTAEQADLAQLFDNSKLRDRKALENMKRQILDHFCAKQPQGSCGSELPKAFDEVVSSLGVERFSEHENPIFTRDLELMFAEFASLLPSEARPQILVGTLPSKCYEAYYVFTPEDYEESPRIVAFDSGMLGLVARISKLVAYMYVGGTIVDGQVYGLQLKPIGTLLNDNTFLVEGMLTTVLMFVDPSMARHIPEVELDSQQRDIMVHLHEDILRFIVAHEYSHALLKHPSTEREFVKIGQSGVQLGGFAKDLERQADTRAAKLLAQRLDLGGQHYFAIAVAAYMEFLHLLDNTKAMARGERARYDTHPSPEERLDAILTALLSERPRLRPESMAAAELQNTITAIYRKIAPTVIQMQQKWPKQDKSCH